MMRRHQIHQSTVAEPGELVLLGVADRGGPPADDRSPRMGMGPRFASRKR
jgi:hypothetical protein